ncbi:hypothetical protein OSB04_008822 [Centaurea solstitialis]|uniref:DUF1639 family protein n=1 Tax=Centaurea solstitialis TaxID=347529 RepID=A0AA38WJW7_9ASTR|nr:hypothetical protein OSB04_008822 [Centaurea solstitialis]
MDNNNRLSKPLHNFTLPPGLSWGRQRFLRCMNVNPIGGGESSDSEEYNDAAGAGSHRREEFDRAPRRGGRSGGGGDSRRRLRFKLRHSLSPSSSPATAAEIGAIRRVFVDGDGDDEISVTREKLVMDFQTEVGRLREAILKNNTSDDDEDDENPPLMMKVSVSPPPEIAKLKRKSRPAPPPPEVISADGGGGGRGGGVINSARPKRNLEKKEEKKIRFSIALSRKEIEEDFIAMIGKKPPRKPKKRPRIIQNDIDAVFPGLWLSEVHPDRYKVNENGGKA